MTEERRKPRFPTALPSFGFGSRLIEVQISWCPGFDSPHPHLINNIYKIKTIRHIMVKKKKSVEEALPKTKEGLGISGFTLGVLSIVMAGSLGVLLAIVGFTFCMIQQKKSPMRLAKAGIILNIIGFVLGAIFFAIYLINIIRQLGVV